MSENAKRLMFSSTLHKELAAGIQPPTRGLLLAPNGVRWSKVCSRVSEFLRATGWCLIQHSAVTPRSYSEIQKRPSVNHTAP